MVNMIDQHCTPTKAKVWKWQGKVCAISDPYNYGNGMGSLDNDMTHLQYGATFCPILRYGKKPYAIHGRYWRAMGIRFPYLSHGNSIFP